ncbi:MAG: hypothetical protein R2722_14115 [Tessaracoccus sp.]
MLKASSMEAIAVSVTIGAVLAGGVSNAPVGAGSVAEQPPRPTASTVIAAAWTRRRICS